MRMGKKKLLQFTAVAICLICLTGCGAGPALPEDTDIPINAQDIPSAGSEGQQQQNGSGTTGDSAELPEGYVYDYQVSLEPIPQEIADLGGMCVGTMHAFPSRIMVGLMKQRMEEDPELKAEVEKRVEEVKQTLSEEIGGEFEVEIMSVEDKWDWVFYCTEKKTGYEFKMNYVNNEYYNPAWHNNVLNVPDYYGKFKADKYEEDVKSIISKAFENSFVNIWCWEGGKGRIDIDVYVAQFIDTGIDYEEEQYKIMQLWEALKGYDSEKHYRIYIGFYPTEYEELIQQKCEQGIWTDIHAYNKEEVELLIKEKDIYDVFFYYEIFNNDTLVNMDTLLNDYKNGTYDETVVWDYWVKGGN